MKAVLVIDIDDSLIEGEERFAIDGYLMQESDCVRCYEAVGQIRNAVLKPMPQKKSHIEGSWNAEKIETTNDFEDGWNACLDEILGETE